MSIGIAAGVDDLPCFIAFCYCDSKVANFSYCVSDILSVTSVFSLCV